MKHSQLASIKESTAFAYLDEITRKYPAGTTIADTPTTRKAGLAGDDLQGQLVLYVPVQSSPVSEAVLQHADDLLIEIRDVAGTVYRAAPNGGG